jgi:cation transport regulator ChaB
MARKKSSGDPPVPLTLERSSGKAQRTYEETLASAERSYGGDVERAHRAAWAAVEHSFEKVGDRWEPKEHRGPSDARAEQGGPDATGPSYGGVDVKGKKKSELLAEARELGAEVTTRMTKDELATAIERANNRKTRQSRERMT